MDWRDYIQVTQYITSIGLFYKDVGRLWRCFRQLNDCQTCSVVKVWE